MIKDRTEPESVKALRHKEERQAIITDVEGRRLREWKGLDTLVAWADNDECHRLALRGTINESGSTPPQE